jgi:transposase
LEWAEARAMAADGISTSEIARRLGINWRTAAKLVAASEPPGYSRARAGSMLDPLEPVLRKLIDDIEDIRAPRVTEILREDYGYTGTVDLVRRRLALLRPRSEGAAQKTGYRPGQVLQVDSAEMPTRPKIAGRERRVHALVLSLPFSGAATAHFSFDTTLESFLQGHVRAFAWLGGVPRECVYDNLRSAVARRERVDGRDVIHWNQRFSRLRGHYAFHAHACTPETPRREGVGRERGPLPEDRLLARPALLGPGRSRRALHAMARPDRAAAPARDRPPRRRRAPRARARAAASTAADCLRRRRTRSSRVPTDGYLKFARCFYRAPESADPAARRAALGPRPRLDRARRPPRRRLPAQL